MKTDAVISELSNQAFCLPVVLTLFVMAFLNRAAGNNLFHLKDRFNLRGKAVLYTLPAFFIVTYCWYQSWQIAGAWTLAYWFWRSPAWGRWIDLNSLPDDYNRIGEKPRWYERIIHKLSFGSDYWCLWWRDLFILPGMFLIDYVTDEIWLTLFSPIIASALVTCYAIPKLSLRGREFVWLAEVLCGAVWGALIIIDLGVQ